MSSYPFMRIAQNHGVPYEPVVCYAEYLRRRYLLTYGTGLVTLLDPGEYWCQWARWTISAIGETEGKLLVKDINDVVRAFLIQRGDIHQPKDTETMH